MKLTIEGTESEIKNVLQAIGSSKEHDKTVQTLNFRFSSSDSVTMKPHILARTASN
ncbi:hypothetical protein LFYK43_14460 [Ligilactobacillus salitolerans]|uniref:Uncharacterized protein n=1 Tax=Ligilactobacillus salitolerans TaxID=1808352 RepID=A0A401IU12_9LACO|nr:hypothetical protein LFYK43_14460 [Ligilactobacillus salitolerans]